MELNFYPENLSVFEKNLFNNSNEESEIKLSYQGYNLITKGYFYNIPFNNNYKLLDDYLT